MEQKSLQVYESLQLRDVRWRNDVVKAHVLERDLDHSLLELDVVEHFESVTVDEEKLVALDFSMARLDQAVVS